MNDPVFSPLTQSTNLFLDTSGARYRIGIPLHANIAADTVGRFARNEKANHPALIHENDDGTVERYTFAELDELACRFAVFLNEIGVKRGESVAIHTAQSPQTAIAHMAIYKIGAVALTLSHLYGPDAIAHVISDSKTKVLVTNSDYWEKLRSRCSSLGSLEHRIVHGSCKSGEINFEDCLTRSAENFEPVITATEDPALLMYTSGSTGMPKGLIHSHRIIHAYLPTLTLVYNLELNYPNAVFWSPADWAWVGGLLDLALPAWQHGQTVVSTNQRFSAKWAFEFMQRHGVTHSFMTPTALKRLAEIPNPRKTWNLSMRVICTGGESLPGDVVRWAQEDFGIVCNEFYGLTEFNHMVGCCKALYPTIPGSMGRAFPGRRVAIIDDNGTEQSDGVTGEIASWKPDDPSLFLGYWGNPGVPEKMRLGNWLKSGDLGVRDENGYFWYHGRNDDLIKSAGYRIGPNEVEDALVSHPDVAEAAVVGKPDRERGSIVMAYVRLMKGVAKDNSTRENLQQFVKDNLAVYKYPREIEFVDSFPLTSSGKIRRNVLRKRASKISDK